VLTVNVSSEDSGIVKIDETTPDSYPISQNVTKDKVVILTAVPLEGFDFIGWSGSLVSTDNPATINMTCPKNIIANFAGKEEFVLTVTIEGGGGTVSPEAGNHGYFEGKVVELVAKPNKGYRFDGWSGDVSNTSSANTTVTVDAAKTVTAKFSAILHTLTIQVEGKGAVTPAPGDHKAIEGSILRIIATPDKGYQFDGWTGTVADAVSNNTTVTLDGSKIVIANFAKIPANWGLIGGIVGGGIVLAGLVGGGALIAARRRRLKSKKGARKSR
jgi:uncharacterized repeat protein (TIGR02543 family)